MIWNVEIQNEYNNLYILLREYIWDFTVVCDIADLEISCYQTCPDIPKIREQLSKLKIAISNTLMDDEDLQEEFDTFNNLLDESEDTYYAEIPIVQTIIQDEDGDFEDDFEDDDYDFDDIVKDGAEDFEDENFEETNR